MDFWANIIIRKILPIWKNENFILRHVVVNKYLRNQKTSKPKNETSLANQSEGLVFKSIFWSTIGKLNVTWLPADNYFIQVWRHDDVIIIFDEFYEKFYIPK